MYRLDIYSGASLLRTLYMNIPERERERESTTKRTASRVEVVGNGSVQFKVVSVRSKKACIRSTLS